MTVEVTQANLIAIGDALGLFPSVIKSGEPWTATCQQTLDRAKAALSSLEGVAGLVEALEAAGAKFREYEQMHEAKIRPPFRGVKWSKQIASENMAAGEKAARNRDMAEMCEAALATFREQGGR